MRIGMVCYASVGGSGVVATELAHALAERDHTVHLISSEPPFRLREGISNVTFEPVVVPSYPLFREPQYLLALANTIARVADEHRLDVVHAHYAVPHATAAYLADRILDSASAAAAPRTITTLHGTDITLVGSDPSYARVVAFSIERSHAVTAVSESLRADTVAALGVRRPIAVIPNFLDCARYQRRVDPALRARLCRGDTEALLVHVSNFRPVKRVDLAVEALVRIRRHVHARLVLIGDGPVRADIERQVAAEGLTPHVEFAGEQHDLVPWLSACDVFLLPSAQESFGLAALEAMACEVPAVAFRIGGLSEIIDDGTTGYLCTSGSVAEMADRAVALLADPVRRAAMGAAAAAAVRARYCRERVVPLYEAVYRDVMHG